MKILQVTFSLSPGGAERFVVDLSNELSKSNDVTLLTLKDDKVQAEKRNFYKFDLSEKVEYVNAGLGDGGSVKSFFKIWKHIKVQKPDIVHLHGEDMPKFCLLAITLLATNVRFIQTIHSDITTCYNNHFYKFYFRVICSILRIGIVSLSEKNYGDLKKYHPYLKHTACIENGRSPIVPTDDFMMVKNEIEEYKLDPEAKVFLHVARCDENKNQILLIEAFNHLISDGANIELLIIGQLFDSSKGKLLQQQACERVHFLGLRKNISDYMLNADAFCLSSKYEGMPITLIEASLAGIPLVSTPVCGAVDIIENEINGALSSSFEPDDYYQALRYVYDNLLELQNASKNMVLNSPYTIEKCAKQYIDFYQNI